MGVAALGKLTTRKFSCAVSQSKDRKILQLYFTKSVRPTLADKRNIDFVYTFDADFVCRNKIRFVDS